MSVASILDAIQRQEECRRQERARADIELVRSLDPDVYAPLGPEPCVHDKDVFGNCTGPCAGEEWN